MKQFVSLLLLCALCVTSLTAQTATEALPAGRRVLVETSQGDFTLLLYDDTPLHQAVFLEFYIVTGSYYTDFDLDDIAAQREWDYTPEQRQEYKMQGGAPWLDRQYTVFGEVIDGMRTITKIEDLPTDSTNRPKRDVIIKRMTLLP